MKFSARKYAQALVEALDFKEADEKVIIKNFLHVLQKRRNLKLLPKILKTFEEEWNAKQGILQISVTYPSKFPEALKHLEEALMKALGKKLSITEKASDSLLGGYQIKVKHMLIDGSVDGQLNKLRKKLMP